MKNHTIFGLALLSLIFILSSCVTPKKPIPGISKESLKGEVCFLNYSTKVAEIQFSGEKQTYKIHPQEDVCLKRFPGRYTYNLKVGRKTNKNLTVNFKRYSTEEIAISFGR